MAGKPPFSCLTWIDQETKPIEEIIKYANWYKSFKGDYER